MGNGPNKTIDKIRRSGMGADLHKLSNQEGFFKQSYHCYLNLNSLRNKIHEMKKVFGDLSLDYFVLVETKINDEFPDSQFLLETYKIRSRRDRTKNEGGFIESMLGKGCLIKL